MVPGIEKAWDIISDRGPEALCRETLAEYDPETGRYAVTGFGRPFFVSPSERRVWSEAPENDLFLKKLSYFYPLSILWYLALARDLPLTGRLVSPVHLKGGQLFFQGSHVLPLDRLATRFDKDPEAFEARGRALGGEPVSHGDVAVRIPALPRIPVTLLLWRSDDEFPARADLLFDSTSDLQLPIDVLWSLAMTATLAMSA